MTFPFPKATQYESENLFQLEVAKLCHQSLSTSNRKDLCGFLVTETKATFQSQTVPGRWHKAEEAKKVRRLDQLSSAFSLMPAKVLRPGLSINGVLVCVCLLAPPSPYNKREALSQPMWESVFPFLLFFTRTGRC